MRSIRRLLVLAPLVLAALGAVALTVLSQLAGERWSADIARAQPPERDAGTPPPEDTDYVCEQPVVEIPKSAGCRGNGRYPRCRWQIPEPTTGSPYTIWRNTTPEHRWGRPGLVSLILATASEYARRWPGEQLTVGDLDAPGPRHRTHDQGHDVDLYLLQAMMARNDGGGSYPDNYADRTPEEVALLRARVMDLARMIATCAGGQIRIYYNDPEIVGPFGEWFAQRGMHSSVGLPMQAHNELHRFHFHLTIADRLAPLPSGAHREEQ